MLCARCSTTRIMKTEASDASGEKKETMATLVAVAKNRLIIHEMENNDIIAAKCRVRNARLPSLDLPAETISYIFELACLSLSSDENRSAEFFQRRNVRCAIASTCLYWRRIAIHTTSLWSFITPISKLGLPPPRSLVNMELERAAGHPIDFYVGNATQDDAKWVVDVLRANMFRCRSLDITLCDAHIIEFLMCEAFTSPHSLARLEYFNYDPAHTIHSGSVLLTVLNLSNVTSLRDIQSDVTSYSTVLIPYGFPQRILVLLPISPENQVRRLYINDNMHPDSIVTYLPMCQRLESLDFFGEEGVDYNLPLTCFPLLKHINVACVGAIRALEVISAPELERLEIDLFRDEERNEDEHDETPSMVGWCSQLAKFPKLRYLSLNLTEPILSSEVLVKFLESHPGLEEIVLEDRGIDMHVAKSLGGSALPKLRQLSINSPIRRPHQTVECAKVLLTLRTQALGLNSLPLDCECMHSLAHSFNLNLAIHPGSPWSPGSTPPSSGYMSQLEDLHCDFPGIVTTVHGRLPIDEGWSWGDEFGVWGSHEESDGIQRGL